MSRHARCTKPTSVQSSDEGRSFQAAELRYRNCHRELGMKRYRPLFNQPSDTPDSERKSNPVRRYATCSCIQPYGNHGKYALTKFHEEMQDTQSDAWRCLEQYIESVRSSGAEIFDPISALGPEMWEQVVTLPASIRTLSSVKYLGLYGSHSVQIPPEIGDLASLEEFDPYTSYRLHWFPYEITRCKKLKRSRVSTRTLYAITNSDRPFLVFPII